MNKSAPHLHLGVLEEKLQRNKKERILITVTENGLTVDTQDIIVLPVALTLGR